MRFVVSIIIHCMHSYVSFQIQIRFILNYIYIYCNIIFLPSPHSWCSGDPPGGGPPLTGGGSGGSGSVGEEKKDDGSWSV